MNQGRHTDKSLPDPDIQDTLNCIANMFGVIWRKPRGSEPEILRPVTVIPPSHGYDKPVPLVPQARAVAKYTDFELGLQAVLTLI